MAGPRKTRSQPRAPRGRRGARGTPAPAPSGERKEKTAVEPVVGLAEIVPYGDDEEGPSLAMADIPLPVLPAEEPRAGTSSSLVRYDPLQRYFSEIRRYPILDREEEHEIAVQYKEKGDVRAAYRLVTSNLRLVILIAREYQRNFHNILDLIQEGNVGLLEAVKHYDPYRGIRFPSYAVWWIRAYIMRYLINNLRMVKLGTTQAQRKLFFNLRKEKERIEAEGFDPGPKLLAERLDVKPEEVVEMEQRLGSSDLSVDAPLSTDEGASLLSVLQAGGIPVDEQLADAEFRQKMSAKIQEFGKKLRGKEQAIFHDRLLSESPLTLQEIGESHGISRERVRQIESNLLAKLKHFLKGTLEEFQVKGAQGGPGERP